MKRRIIILAALALIAFDRASLAEDPGRRLLSEAAGQGIHQPLRPHRSRLAYHRSYGGYPVACEAVIFPRSPLCAGRPATFGPYAPFPWNLSWYY